MNYIDVKCTIWTRYHFKEAANMKGLSAIIEESGFEAVVDADLGYAEIEEMLDTEERLEPVDNRGQSTIEIYLDSQKIWENGEHE